MHDVAPMRDIEEYLAAQESKSLLRFITCGSVDDGKSTLIGRLLYDAKLIFEDQLAVLAKDSRKHGTNGEEIDLALLVDGLEAEREQGITIDVAYRFFATEKRKFIVADTPGHEQYTRNMATGASTAQLAVLLADARAGLLTQTRRHAFIANLLGVKHIVLAVNKIDLVNFDAARFGEISAAFQELASYFSFSTAISIPISARYGDNVSQRSERMDWYSGPTLIEHLETVPVEEDEAAKPFRMPVQWVNRPHLNFRGYSGTVASGTVRPGDRIAVPSSGRTSAVKAIVTSGGELAEAAAGDAVTLTLADEIDISRGDILVSADDRPEYSDQLGAHVIWMTETPLLPGRPYLMRMNGKTVTASVTSLKYKIDINNNYEHLAAKDLVLNEIGVCNLALSAPVAFDPYTACRKMGSFILIDRQTNATVAAGMVKFGLRRATNIHQHSMDIDKAARAALNGQKPVILWFTGLSGSGKSTIANLLEKELFARGCRTYLLDGDNVRHGLNRDLGFTATDRVENIRRVGEVAKLFVDAGLIVITSFISPFRAERQMARELVAAGEFLEIFVDTPIEVCRQRDPKGLYRKADEGKIPNFTGVDSPYEAPEAPELRLSTTDHDPAQIVQSILSELKEQSIIPT